ncbi:MAG: hypothetical protein NUV46_01935 [Nanoarchaeota archaeon]|nr:hypothetical protein [Nanoarchaeota archaeon]
METKRKIEFLVAGMFVVFLLILVLGVLSLEEEKSKKSERLKIYERSSKVVLDRGFYYSEEKIKMISLNNGVYKEYILERDSMNFRNRIFTENEFFFERTVN